MKAVLAFVFFLTYSICLFSQKKFDVTLSFPQALDLSKLNLQIDNGFGRSSIPFKIGTGNEINLSGIYYSKYAAVVLSYPKAENWNYSNFFFLDNKPASIKFLIATKDSSPFDNYTLSNAYDFKGERDSMDAFVANEAKEEKDYFNKYGSMIFDGKHQDLQDQFFGLDQKVYKKIIEYIKTTNNSYFSFWYFISNARYSGLSVDSLLSIFDKTFSDDRKKTVEGNAFRQLLIGKLETKKGNLAAVFMTKDINGKAVTLSSFKNKKYVLLDFWATWCGPCIKKMPTLGELRKRFSQEFEIISIAYPTTLSETKQVIVKQKMNWINIYNDEGLINSYGGMGAIPRLFLIDKSGKIIYDNQKDNDADLKILMNILEENIGGK